MNRVSQARVGLRGNHPTRWGGAARALMGAFVLGLAGLAPSALAWTFAEGVRAHPPMHGRTPLASDVVFSTRSQRPEAPAQAQAFEATRIEWVYSLNPTYNGKLKAVAPWLGATIGATWRVTDPAAYAKDFDGETIVHPRMKAWGGQWLTTTHPATRSTLFAVTSKAVEAGADSIQIDDPLMQWYAATLWGGDFNDSTLAGFQAFLDRYPDRAKLARAGLAEPVGNYRQWLVRQHGIQSAEDYKQRWRDLPSTEIWLAYIRATVADFYVDLRRELAQRSSRPIPLSMNLTFLDAPDAANRHFFLALLADYAIAETPLRGDLDLAMRAATHRALGLGWVPSILPADRARNRAAIALAYALGGTPLVPWDTYTGNQPDGQPARFYGSPADYADLYRFVRATRPNLDGHETVAPVGLLVPVDQYDAALTRRLVGQLWERQIPFAFLPTGPAFARDAAARQRRSAPSLVIRAAADPAFDPADLTGASGAVAVEQAASAVSTEQLDALRPFVVAPGGGQVRVVPRAHPDRPDTLVLHLVDTGRAEPDAATPDCRRRLGIRRSLLGPFTAARVERRSLAGDTEALIDSRDPGYLFVSLRGCSLWDQVVLHLQRPPA